MTPQDIATSARQKYNAVGDTFFPDANIYNWIYQAEMILATKAEVIEQLYSAATVANQQSYAYPTNAFAIKRITVNGRKLKRITARDDDSVTIQNSLTTQTGMPAYYTDYNSTIYLRVIPDAVYTMYIYTFNVPALPTATSTLEVPVNFHMDIVDYVVSEMFSQDQNSNMAAYHRKIFEQHVLNAIAFKKRRKRTDGFATVQCEEVLPTSVLGEI